VTGSYERGNEPLISIVCGYSLGHLYCYWLLNQEAAAWSWWLCRPLCIFLHLCGLRLPTQAGALCSRLCCLKGWRCSVILRPVF